MISESRLDSLVDAAWVADHLDDPGVRLIEVDVSPAAYSEGHVPGAVLWNAYSDLRDAEYRPVAAPVFEALVSRSGIAPDTVAVIYGYGAYLGFWLLKAFGHADVRVFAGGRAAWTASGGELVTEVAPPPATAYSLAAPDRAILADREEVARAAEAPGTVILDVRAPLEFGGERFWPSGATADTGRAGHIPGAVSVPIDPVRDESGEIRDRESLRRLFSDAGVLPGKRVIIYCTIGNRASLAWYLLTTQLGYPDVAVYHGSYVEWGKLPDAVVEGG